MVHRWRLTQANIPPAYPPFRRVTMAERKHLLCLVYHRGVGVHHHGNPHEHRNGPVQASTQGGQSPHAAQETAAVRPQRLSRPPDNVAGSLGGPLVSSLCVFLPFEVGRDGPSTKSNSVFLLCSRFGSVCLCACQPQQQQQENHVVVFSPVMPF